MSVSHSISHSGNLSMKQSIGIKVSYSDNSSVMKHATLGFRPCSIRCHPTWFICARTMFSLVWAHVNNVIVKKCFWSESMSFSWLTLLARVFAKKSSLSDLLHFSVHHEIGPSPRPLPLPRRRRHLLLPKNRLILSPVENARDLVKSTNPWDWTSSHGRITDTPSCPGKNSLTHYSPP